MSRTPNISLEDREKLQGSFGEDVVAQHRALEAAPDNAIVNRFAFMGPFLTRLFAVGVEARGVERVPEDQRDTKNTWNKYAVSFCLRCHRALIQVPFHN